MSEPPLPYHDRPELSETFVDTVRLTHWDGHTARIEFAVTRPLVGPEPNASNPIQYPVARLVLPPIAVAELFQQLAILVRKFEQDGLIKRISPGSDLKQ